MVRLSYKKITFISLFFLLITIFVFILHTSVSPQKYILSSVYQGDLLLSLHTSGIINPKQIISVGTQVSGIVQNVYVEENSMVKKNQMIATLDQKLFSNDVQKNQAVLDKVAGKISLLNLRVARLTQLIKSKFASQDSLDEMLSELKIEESNYALAQAELAKSKIELNYTAITSPIEGIILEKLIEPGQTVAASFATPVLFKIAKNLSDMQIITKVSEADIPLVIVGQEAQFTINSFPNQIFKAQVEKIKIGPNSQQGIITYDVILKTNNSNKILKPGMTANITIILKKVLNTRYVLNDAFRFAAREDNHLPLQEIYIFEHHKKVAISVTTGLKNDTYTEILTGLNMPSPQIIVGIKDDEPN